MFIFVGLGNPGKKYQATRHNVGWLVLDEIKKHYLAKKSKFLSKKKLKSQVCFSEFFKNRVVLIKPETFMNNSGLAVSKVIKAFTDYQLVDREMEIDNLYVIHDDLDLPLGSYKIQFGKGPHQHNGLSSVEQHLKTKAFWRIRIGIASEHYQKIKLEAGSIAEEYILKPFAQAEKEVIDKVIHKITEELLTLNIFTKMAKS